MSTGPTEVVEYPLPPVTGSIGITQGAYGDRGNLELVAPDPDDGFWVFWFNGDALEHRSGAARGHWNAGLHVPTGSRLRSARISQMPFGPNFLEVVGRAEPGGLHRWYWTPDDGFLAGETIASTAGGEPARIVVSADRLTTMRVADAGVEVLTSDAQRYPALLWHTSHVPVHGDATWVDLAPAPQDARSWPVLGLVVADGRAILLRPGDPSSIQPPPAQPTSAQPTSTQPPPAQPTSAQPASTHSISAGHAAVELPGRWRTAQLHVLAADSGVITGQNTDGRLRIVGVHLRGGAARANPDASGWQCTGPAVDDVAACLSTLPADLATHGRARTLEVVTRTGTELHHLRLDAHTLRPHSTGTNAVRARVWN